MQLSSQQLDDIIDILDPDNHGVLNLVSQEWIDRAYEIIFTGKKHKPETFLLYLLYITNQLYRFSSGCKGVSTFIFDKISRKAFGAARFDPYFSIDQLWHFLHSNGLSEIEDIIESVLTHTNRSYYSVTFKGRDYLEEILGDITLPKIEDDEIDDYDPYTDDGVQVSADDERLDNTDCSGLEPADDSPEKHFNQNTMMTIKDMEKLSGRSRKWVDMAIESANISPCFIPKIKSRPRRFWRTEAMKAIDSKNKQA